MNEKKKGKERKKEILYFSVCDFEFKNEKKRNSKQNHGKIIKTIN